MRDHVNEELISAYLDNEVTQEEREQVEKSLAESAECRQLFDELQSLQGSLRSLPRFTLPNDFADRVLQEAERRQRPETVPMVAQDHPKAKYGLLKVAAAVATVAAALLVALIFAGPDGGAGPDGPGDSKVAQSDPISEQDPATPSAETFVRQQQQLILVFDVAVTPQGQIDNVFASALRQAGIRFDPDQKDVRLREALQKDLLDSRFIGDVRNEDAADPQKVRQDNRGRPADHSAFDIVEMVYVRGSGQQLDSVYAFLWAHEHSHVRLDMGLEPQETRVLNRVGSQTWTLAAAEHGRESRAYRLRFRIGLQTGSRSFLGKFPTPRITAEVGPGREGGLPPFGLEFLLGSGSSSTSRQVQEEPPPEPDAKAEPEAPNVEDWAAETYEVLVILRNLKEDLPIGPQPNEAPDDAAP